MFRVLNRPLVMTVSTALSPGSWRRSSRGEGGCARGRWSPRGAWVEGAVHRVVRLLREAIDGATRGAAEFRRTRREVVQGSHVLHRAGDEMHHDEPFVSCALRRDHQWRDGREGFPWGVASPATSAPSLLWEKFQSHPSVPRHRTI